MNSHEAISSTTWLPGPRNSPAAYLAPVWIELDDKPLKNRKMKSKKTG